MASFSKVRVPLTILLYKVGARESRDHRGCQAPFRPTCPVRRRKELALPVPGRVTLAGA